MNIYLVAGFVLLVVMVFLILRPFVVATPLAAGVADVPDSDVSDAAARARAAARVETVAQVAPGAPVAPVATASAAGGDVRASVEAAIAARKAALSGAVPVAAERLCPSCESAVDPDDAFCRSCGAQQLA